MPAAEDPVEYLVGAAREDGDLLKVECFQVVRQSSLGFLRGNLLDEHKRREPPPIRAGTPAGPNVPTISWKVVTARPSSSARPASTFVLFPSGCNRSPRP